MDVFVIARYIPFAPLGLWRTGLWRFYTPSAPLGLLEAGAQCAPYKCVFQTGSKSDEVSQLYFVPAPVQDFVRNQQRLKCSRVGPIAR